MNDIPVTSYSPSLPARASLAVIGLMVTLPFLQVYHTHPVPAFYIELTAFGLGLAALSLLLSGRYWQNLALPPVILAPAGLFLVLLLQLNLGMAAYHETLILALLYLVWAILLVILGSVLRQEAGFTAACTTLAWYFLAGGEVSAIIGVMQQYDIHSFLDDFIAARSWPAISGNIGQTNHYANYICLALASLLFLSAAGRLSALTALLLALPLLFVLPLSASRSTWLYLFALLALSLLYRLYSKDSRANATGLRLVILSCLLITGCALMQWLVQTAWFAAPPQGTENQLTIADKLFVHTDSIGIRLHLWHEAWLMFLQAPLLGVGFGQFSWHHFQMLTQLPNPANIGIYNNAHNLFLQLLAETGLAGTLFVIAGLLLWLAGLRKQSFDLALWWLLALLSIIGIHSLVEFPLWYSHMLGPAAILLGAGSRNGLLLRLPRLGTLLMFVILAAGSWTIFSVKQDYQKIEQVMGGPHSTPQGKTLDSNDFALLQTLHGRTLLSPYVDYALASAIDFNREKLDLKLAVNQRVMRFHPSGPAVYRQAILLALNHQPEAAIRQAEKAMAAYPAEFVLFADSLEQLLPDNPDTLQPLLDWVQHRQKEQATSKQE